MQHKIVNALEKLENLWMLHCAKRSQKHGLDLMQPPLCREIFTLWAQMADFWQLR
jgi:hypothetical protein